MFLKNINQYRKNNISGDNVGINQTYHWKNQQKFGLGTYGTTIFLNSNSNLIYFIGFNIENFPIKILVNK